MKIQTWKIVEQVWHRNRLITPAEISFLQLLPGSREDRPALENALRYLGVWDQYEAAGRPAFGKFKDWWRKTDVFA